MSAGLVPPTMFLWFLMICFWINTQPYRWITRFVVWWRTQLTAIINTICRNFEYWFVECTLRHRSYILWHVWLRGVSNTQAWFWFGWVVFACTFVCVKATRMALAVFLNCCCLTFCVSKSFSWVVNLNYACWLSGKCFGISVFVNGFLAETLVNDFLDTCASVDLPSSFGWTCMDDSVNSVLWVKYVDVV